MSALFLKILNLSINASWLILAVIVARLLLKKAPRWISCLLWGLVAVRLLCPISLESVLSILPSAKVVPENIEMVQDPHIDSGVRIIDNAVNPVIEKSFSPDAASSVNPMQVVVFMGSIIWLTGMTVMLLYALISYILLRRKVRASVAMNDRVKECDEVGSPFILGIFRPEIYVPSGIDENTLELVIAHEEAHLKRNDHWWKPFGFVLLAVYWFNPLCWVAYILLCRDIEAACDEKVIKDKDREYMAAYSQALLDCSVNRRINAACPLAFGETGVKERVKGVLNYKKPALGVIIVAIVACIVVAVCFMTNPKSRYSDITVKIPAGSEAEQEETESITDWMDITLPSGYSISSFDDAIGYMGGSLILPRSYHAEDSEYGPLEWQYSGLISRLPADSGMATVSFDNGIPDPSSMPRDNHTDTEYLKTIGLERSNTQWYAVMLKENHDLYTASQLSEMKDEGIDLTGKELTSDYWSFWFVKEGEDTYYLLTLSAKEFTQEEAEEIARTVSIK